MWLLIDVGFDLKKKKKNPLSFLDCNVIVKKTNAYFRCKILDYVGRGNVFFVLVLHILSTYSLKSARFLCYSAFQNKITALVTPAHLVLFAHSVLFFPCFSRTCAREIIKVFFLTRQTPFLGITRQVPTDIRPIVFLAKQSWHYWFRTDLNVADWQRRVCTKGAGGGLGKGIKLPEVFPSHYSQHPEQHWSLVNEALLRAHCVRIIQRCAPWVVMALRLI